MSGKGERKIRVITGEKTYRDHARREWLSLVTQSEHDHAGRQRNNALVHSTRIAQEQLASFLAKSTNKPV